MTRSEQLWVSDLAGDQQVVLTDFKDLVHDVRIDQAETLTFEIPATGTTVAEQKAAFVVEDVDVRWRDRWFTVRRLETRRNGSEVTIRAECDAIWYRLAEKVRVGSVNILDTTPADGLDTLLDGTGWVRSEASTTSTTRYAMEIEDGSVLAALRRWALVTGTFLTFNHTERSVTLATTRGRTLGVGFRYGRNVTSIRREVIPPYATRLFPYGADGLTIAGINGGLEYLDDFSWYTDQGLSLGVAEDRYLKSRVWSDLSFTEDTALKAAAEAKLAAWAQPTITYECAVTDLSELTGLPEDVRIGDRVRCVDELVGVDIETTVVRYVNHPLEPWRNQVELAYLYDPLSDTDSTARPSASREWLMFKSDNVPMELRSDGSWVTNRIGLAFREGGEAVFGFDVTGVPSGDGTLTIQFLDADEDPDAEVHEPIVIDYLDGVPIKTTATWALKELAGQYDYRVRMTAVATGGPSATLGVDIDRADSRFWILAHGAVRQTPVVVTEERFDRDPDLYATPDVADIQYFTVPDNVTEVEIEVGGAGTFSHWGADPGAGASGAVIVAKFAVVPGTVYDVYCGSKGGSSIAGNDPSRSVGGWPDGGAGGEGNTGNANWGHAGAGSSQVRPTGGAKSTSLIVAGAAGGPSKSDLGGAGGSGGAGGVVEGAPGTSPLTGDCGGGATRTAGGAGGERQANPGPAGNGEFAESGSFTKGGDANESSDSFQDGPAGGGGGGWYGGGGGATNLNPNVIPPSGGGGGGSSYIAASAIEIVSATDGANNDYGYVIFRWEDPFTDI